MQEKELGDWQLLEKEEGPDLPLFKAEFRHMQNPRNGKVLKAIVLAVPDTINIIAITMRSELLLVEQFRFGIHRKLVELPAGLMDDNESPLEAAKRELLEETGYVAENWILLGKSFINPAYVNNACYHFLAQGAVQVAETLPDELEDLKVILYPLKDLGELLYSEILNDAVGVSAVAYLGKYLDAQARLDQRRISS